MGGSWPPVRERQPLVGEPGPWDVWAALTAGHPRPGPAAPSRQQPKAGRALTTGEGREDVLAHREERGPSREQGREALGAWPASCGHLIPSPHHAQPQPRTPLA